ncbi:MAG TPA: hypothetical protein ENH55_06870 [Aurantimonas coralicida]|uniref:Integrase catalytic domain-containing protein n=2 Tax=root TaxID=1 RepID=A0A9C9NED2_9HYPH|nr:hypothetical protein [Aurantimonas coralicida]HET99758.1 hypothetical protein [Aurantimonas coralicida]
MTVHVPSVRVTTGAHVRVNGQPYIVGRLTDTARIFTHRETGDELLLPLAAQITMMRNMQLTAEATFGALDRNAQMALSVAWDAFDPAEQISAKRKYPFVKAVDDLPICRRDKSKFVLAAIEPVNAEVELPFEGGPSFRLVRKWYRKWLAGGRDIRVLVDWHNKKGNRTKRLPEWVYEEISAAIDEAYACDPPGTEAAAQERATNRILMRADRDRLPLPPGAKKVIGQHVARRAIARRDGYELATIRLGRKEAERLFKMVGAGPCGDYPLHEVEVDHTLVDLSLIDKHGAYMGRAWLTILIDRHSRMIVGFSLSFNPPSWLTVMDALQMAIMPKEDVIANICKGRRMVTNRWDVFGAPDNLFVDRGAEFRSISMRGTEAALNMRIVDLPPGQPWLKGKIERYYGTLNTRVFHRLPGTTFSSVAQRRLNHHDAEKQACLTLGDLRWIILTWIVDIYHQEVHATTGQTPSARWARGIAEVGAKMPPPPEILEAVTGNTIRSKLRSDGVRYSKLRWNSNAFQALRSRYAASLPVRERRTGNADVLVRINPLDISRCWVLDEKDGTWVEGDLVSGDGAEDMTLAEWKRVSETVTENQIYDVDAALSRAKADQAIRDHVDLRRKPSSKRKAKLREDGRKAAEHVRPDRDDSQASMTGLVPHDLDQPPAIPAQDARGPWREQALPMASAQVIPPPRPEGHAAVPVSPPEENATLPEPCAASEADSKKPFTVRRRK